MAGSCWPGPCGATTTRSSGAAEQAHRVGRGGPRHADDRAGRLRGARVLALGEAPPERIEALGHDRERHVVHRDGLRHRHPPAPGGQGVVHDVGPGLAHRARQPPVQPVDVEHRVAAAAQRVPADAGAAPAHPARLVHLDHLDLPALAQRAHQLADVDPGAGDPAVGVARVDQDAHQRLASTSSVAERRRRVTTSKPMLAEQPGQRARGEEADVRRERVEAPLEAPHEHVEAGQPAVRRRGHGQPPSRAEHAPRLGEQQLHVAHVLERVGAEHEVERGVVEGQAARRARAAPPRPPEAAGGPIERHAARRRPPRARSRAGIAPSRPSPQPRSSARSTAGRARTKATRCGAGGPGSSGTRRQISSSYSALNGSLP